MKLYNTNWTLSIARKVVFSGLDNKSEIGIFDVIDISSGINLPKGKINGGNFQVYGGGGATGLTHDQYNVDYETIGIGRVGARCGCVFIISNMSWVTDNALYAHWINPNYDIAFLRHYLDYLNLNTLSNQTAQPLISKGRLKNIKIPVLDLQQQRKIALALDLIEDDKVDNKLFEELGLLKALKIVADWYRLNEHLNNLLYNTYSVVDLRRSILKEAVQGKLVPQEPTDEPASELLKKIQAEKEWLVKENKIKKEKPLPPIQKEEMSYELPRGWEWVRLGNIVHIVRGSSPRPKGSPIHFSDEPTKYHWITIWDITNKSKNNILKGTKEYLTEEGCKKSRFMDVGEIIIAVSGSVGKSCILGIEGFIYDGLAGLKYITNDILRDYLSVYLKSWESKLNNMSEGTSWPNINTDNLNKLVLPLPPLNEQYRIVAKVDKLMQDCDVLEASIVKAQADSEQLMQAVLQEACGN